MIAPSPPDSVFVPPSDLVAIVLAWAQTRWKVAWNAGIRGAEEAQRWEGVIILMEADWVMLDPMERAFLGLRPAAANQNGKSL